MQERSTSTRPSLLSRVRDPADADAWREFDERYRGLVVRYGLARGLQVSDAEDVAQIVLTSLVKSLARFRYSPEIGRFRDYLGRAVRNAVARHRARPAPRTGAATQDLTELAGEADLERDEAWEAEWRDHHYRRALAELRRTFEPTSVEAFERILAGGTVPDVARALGLSTDAVYKAKQRVRDRLRRLIAKQIDDEEFPERRQRPARG